MGLRFRRWPLALGHSDGSDPQDIRHICRFRFGNEFVGDVVGIPMPPEDFLSDPEVALKRMIRAVHWSSRDGIRPVFCGCWSREALQAHFDVPVTTGHLHRRCLYRCDDRLSQTGQDRVAVVNQLTC